MSDVFRELSHTCLLKQSSTLVLVAGLEAVVVGLTIEIVSLVPATFLLPQNRSQRGGFSCGGFVSPRPCIRIGSHGRTSHPCRPWCELP